MGTIYTLCDTEGRRTLCIEKAYTFVAKAPDGIYDRVPGGGVPASALRRFAVNVPLQKSESAEEEAGSSPESMTGFLRWIAIVDRWLAEAGERPITVYNNDVAVWEDETAPWIDFSAPGGKRVRKDGWVCLDSSGRAET